ncbi:MAG TPA: hypothetical protein VM008_01125 [Phycisphaerae bacterium]|nr:hypothetical protein [Phycisphaerae bacterium]
MFRRALFATFAVFAVSSLSAFGDAKDDLMAAVKKTADGPNYSWSSKVEMGGNALGAGTSTGKTEKDGYTWVNQPVRDQTYELMIKGKKAMIKTDDGWKTAEELSGGGGGGGGFNPQRMLAMMASNYQTPLVQAERSLKNLDTVKAETDGFSGNLTEEGAKQMLMFRRPPNANGGDGGGPEVTNAKADVRVWTKDGEVTKLQYHVTGSVSFNGNDREVDRTTTIEIKDVGTTKVVVPDEVKKKLEASDTTQPQ